MSETAKEGVGMDRQTKEKLDQIRKLLTKRFRRVRHPLRVMTVSCAVMLAAGLLAGNALGKSAENKRAVTAMKKQTKKQESLEKELSDANSLLKARDEKERPWYLMLVNQSHPMEEGYVPELADIDSEHQVDKRILEPLQKMLADAEKEGYGLYACSAYRSVDRQKELFNQSMADYISQGMSYYESATETAKSIAWPGESEHATGLALDIVSVKYQGLDDKQGETEEQKWLMEHCYDYGFILRYPKDKMNNTGIIYEPWHYRYVGVEDAKRIKELGVTLEEYLDEEY